MSVASNPEEGQRQFLTASCGPLDLWFRWWGHSAPQSSRFHYSAGCRGGPRPRQDVNAGRRLYNVLTPIWTTLAKSPLTALDVGLAAVTVVLMG